MSFIGIAINIWRDTKGTGGGGETPEMELLWGPGNFLMWGPTFLTWGLE